MVKVSVVVPIYNVSQYIERCVRSLFEQTLETIEFIFVNDCTLDDSIVILERLMEEYPERKKQSRIIHHEKNQGLACSRIDGIKVATGEYIIHCDSDDWVDTDLYEKLYNKAEEMRADITICDFQCEYGSGREPDKIVTNFSGTPRQALENMHRESFYCMVWRALMRREFVVEHCLFPLPHVDMWEDVCVTIPAFYYANKIAKVNDPVYHYFVNAHSYSANSARPKLYEDRKATIKHLESFFSDKNDIDVHLLIAFWKILAKSYLLTTANFDPKRWKKEFKEAHAYIMQMKSIPLKIRFLYKLTTFCTFPIHFIMWIKIHLR